MAVKQQKNKIVDAFTDDFFFPKLLKYASLFRRLRSDAWVAILHFSTSKYFARTYCIEKFRNVRIYLLGLQVLQKNR